MQFTFQESCGIEQSELKAIAAEKGLIFFHETMKEKAVFDGQYATPYSCLQLPFDENLFKKAQKLVDLLMVRQPTMVVVVGIGGSSLGAKAVLQALQGRLRDPQRCALPLYFAETVDSDRMTTILSLVERELQLGNSIVLTVITKSGTTVETLANFYVLLDLLKRYAPKTYQEMIVVISDEGSPLSMYGMRKEFHLFSLPKAIGGRYSVFSAVGLVPLLLAGIDVEQLRAGARAITQQCFENSMEKNPALMSALIQYSHYKKGVGISDLFLFSIDLEAVGKWYRQLLAESIGKEYDLHGNRVLVGITPTVSLGSIDLHSVAQLYLGGPRDKYTTFVTIEQTESRVTLPTDAPQLGGKTFSEIMYALAEGTQRAYQSNNRPFSTILLPKKDAFSLGQLLQWKMLEVMYLGFLLQVDCFDQPNVELYKKEAAEVLKNKRIV